MQTLDIKTARIRKVRESGRPETDSHLIEIEATMPRRKAIRLVLPFFTASLMLNLNRLK